ncbi:MAG: LCP family protein [Acidimicrobiia bacterium]
MLAALLSALIPGTGQLYAGKRRRGWILIGLSAAALLVAIGVYSRGKIFVAKLAVDPTMLVLFLIANAVGLSIRMFAVVDAYLAARRLGSERHPDTAFVTALGLAFLVFLTVIPHGWLGRRNLAAYDLITSISAVDENQAAPTSPAPTSEDQQRTDGEGVGPAATTSSSTTTTTLPKLWEGEERLGILLMGADSGPGRRGIRTDTLMVLSIDPETGYAAMFGVPRNMAQIPFPPGSPAAENFDCHCFPQIANEIYPYGLGHPELFPGGPNSGANAVKSSLGELLGIEIHYFVLANLQGFVGMVDALGGVTINVTRRVYDAEYPHEEGSTVVIDIPVGVHHMDGSTALAYARSRRTSDDYDRMGRQRCVVEALVDQADTLQLLSAFPSLVPIIIENVLTDVPIGQLPDLIELGAKVDTDQIVTVRLVPPDYISGRDSQRYPIPNLERIRSTVQTAISLPPAQAIAALNLQSLEAACPELEIETETGTG